MAGRRLLYEVPSIHRVGDSCESRHGDTTPTDTDQSGPASEHNAQTVPELSNQPQVNWEKGYGFR